MRVAPSQKGAGHNGGQRCPCHRYGIMSGKALHKLQEQNSAIACWFESFFVTVGGPGKNTGLDRLYFEWCSSRICEKWRCYLVPVVCLVNMVSLNLWNWSGIDPAVHYYSSRELFVDRWWSISHAKTMTQNKAGKPCEATKFVKAHHALLLLHSIWTGKQKRKYLSFQHNNQSLLQKKLSFTILLHDVVVDGLTQITWYCAWDTKVQSLWCIYLWWVLPTLDPSYLCKERYLGTWKDMWIVYVVQYNWLSMFE